MSEDRETSQRRRSRFESEVGPLVEPLRRFLRRRTDPDTAEDVLAETLLVCWRRLEDLPAGPLPWAYATARHCLANAERGARRRARLAARLAAMGPRDGETASPTDPPDTAAAGVPAALARLPDGDAEVLRLWAWEELGASEIAQVLGITPNAASIRLHRARGKLRRALTGVPAREPRKRSRPAGHEEGRGGAARD